MATKPHVYGTLPKAKRSTTTLTWPVCKRCGLVLLMNEITNRAARQPCPGDEEKGGDRA